MSRAKRNQRATLPVSRNLVGPSTPNRDTRIPLTGAPMMRIGYTGRKGRSNGQHVGMWGLLSQNYKTPVTIDVRWSQTVGNLT